jgi:hypothetical protein
MAATPARLNGGAPSMRRWPMSHRATVELPIRMLFTMIDPP